MFSKNFVFMILLGMLGFGACDVTFSEENVENLPPGCPGFHCGAEDYSGPEGTIAEEVIVLDSECNDEIDYVVRTVYPKSLDSSGITIRLSDAQNIEDAEMFEFAVSACRNITLDGLFVQFHTYGVFDEEENQDATDPEGFLLPDWSERFYNFTLLEDGEVVKRVGIATEMSVSDTGGSAHFRSLSRVLKAGEMVTYTFSASVRPEWSTYASFVTGIGDQLGGLIFNAPPDPNPLDRRIPWGVYITYPQMVSIVP